MSIFPHLYTYTTNRQNALVNMVFNMGGGRVRKFVKMIAAVEAEDWKEAAAQAKDSDWHTQVGARAIEVEKLLEGG